MILDVVYNHLGPGRQLPAAVLAATTSATRHRTSGATPINFDGADAGPVREFFVANAGYWIDEFHLDGLRLDATQDIFDASPEHILPAIARAGAARRAGRRSVLLVAENEPQDVAARPRRRRAGGYGLDAPVERRLPPHARTVALTGRHEAYYTDYRGTPQELISARASGATSTRASATPGRRSDAGRPTSGPGAGVASSTYLQNHDQVANSARGAAAATR